MRRPVTDREVYPALWITLAMLVLGYLLWRYGLGRPTVSGCWFYRNFHLYCPGCGGTRAVQALLHGQLFRSVRYHPAVLLTACWTAVYMLSQTLWRFRGRQGWVLRYSPRCPGILLMVFLTHCAVRNLLWLGFGIPL